MCTILLTSPEIHLHTIQLSLLHPNSNAKNPQNYWLSFLVLFVHPDEVFSKSVLVVSEDSRKKVSLPPDLSWMLQNNLLLENLCVSLAYKGFLAKKIWNLGKSGTNKHSTLCDWWGPLEILSVTGRRGSSKKFLSLLHGSEQSSSAKVFVCLLLTKGFW